MEIKSLEAWRKGHYWSQGTLARKVKIDKGVISRLEAGRSHCRLETAKQIAEALSIKPEQVSEFRNILDLDKDLDNEISSDEESLQEEELAELLERIKVNEGKPGIPHDQAVAEFARFYEELEQKRSQGIKATA